MSEIARGPAPVGVPAGQGRFPTAGAGEGGVPPFVPAQEPLTVSVIVPVHDGGMDFRRCMDSLGKAVPAPDEVIVVADGDTDGSAQVAEEFGARVLRVDGPRGPASARNLGVAAARGSIVFFVDSDVEIHADAVGVVARCFQRQPDLAAVFGTYDDSPSEPDFLSQYKNLLHHYTHTTSHEDASSFWSGCGAVRRRVFMDVGGYDEEERYPSIEDIRLGYRLRKSGHRIRMCKELQAKHLKHWGAARLLTTDFLQRALPWTVLIMRQGSIPNDLNLKLASRFSAVAVYLLIGVCMAGLIQPVALLAVPVLVGLLLALNWSLYRFYWRKRGWWFALRAVVWHWLYYFYSALGFAVGALLYLLGRWGREPSPAGAAGRGEATRP